MVTATVRAVNFGYDTRAMAVQAPRPIGDLLESAMPQLGPRLVEVRIHAAWRAIVGGDVARRARPVGLTGATLSVAVDNSPWLQELTLRTEEFTRAVAARFPEVKALRFTLGSLLPAASTPPGAPAPPERRLTEDDHRDIDAAVGAIADPMLAAAARRLLLRARRAAPRGSAR